MKASLSLALAAILASCALSRPAAAQATIPLTGSVSDAGTIPRIPAAAVPGDPGTKASPAPNGKINTLYPGGVPARDIDAGNSRAAQPRSGQAMPGAQPTKRIFQSRKQRGE